MTPSSYQIAMNNLAEELAREKSGQKDLSRSRSLELELTCKDSSTIWAEVKMSFLSDSEGHPMGILGVSRDIRQRKQAEQALKESEQKYRSVVDNIGIGVALISPKMEVLTLNRQMKKWFPAVDETKKPICYRSFNFPPRENVCPYCPTSNTLKIGEVYEAVTDTPAGDNIINYRVISSPIKDSDGNVIAAIEMVEDITERMRAERELQEKEAQYRGIFESANDAIFISDSKGRIVEANPQACKMYDYSHDELIKLTNKDLIHPDYHHLFETIPKRYKDKRGIPGGISECPKRWYFN